MLNPYSLFEPKHQKVSLGHISPIFFITIQQRKMFFVLDFSVIILCQDFILFSLSFNFV